MAQGTVKWFHPSKGYGFIAQDDHEQDAFVHVTAVQRAGMITLTEGQILCYNLELQKNGRPVAVNLSLVP